VNSLGDIAPRLSPSPLKLNLISDITSPQKKKMPPGNDMTARRFVKMRERGPDNASVSPQKEKPMKA
jgi:hypothetical protein